MKKKKVAVVGATGIAGQQFLEALANHPWFEVDCLGGSDRSKGKTYQQAITTEDGHCHWYGESALPSKFASMTMKGAHEIDASQFDVIFTAVDSNVAKEIEPLYAKTTPVISTASAFRMQEDVPLLIPGINNDHAKLVEGQRKKRGWQGFVVPIPNCTTYGLVCSLAPLHQKFGVKTAIMTSLQAISGAGRNSGVLGLDIIDNIVPHISGEEDKVQQETMKILGRSETSSVTPAQMTISATCLRVPVINAHFEAVTVATDKACHPEDAMEAYQRYETGLKDLPSAPKNFFVCHEDPFRPQPRLDRDVDGGMATHIGRIRKDAAMGGIKYVLLSHNTKAGAAKGAILVAEFLSQQGYIY
jgi:aspartate-semialdehyde dehydrogenase